MSSSVNCVLNQITDRLYLIQVVKVAINSTISANVATVEVGLTLSNEIV